MAMTPQEIAAAGDAYIAKLAADANAREGLASASGAAEVAKHISSVTGMNVGESDVKVIGDHLNASHSAQCEELAMQYPALGEIVTESD